MGHAVCHAIGFVIAAIGLASSPAAAQAPKRVVIGLPWTPQAEHCGFYQALEDGRYAKRGLDVVLQPGGPEVNSGLLLASGRLDFAITDMLAVLRLHAGGIPAVAVAAYFQKDPQSLVVHPNDGVASLADLKGHPVMVANAQRNGFWQWVRAKYGLDDAQLRPYAFTSAPFIADPHAAQQGYITNDGYVLGKAVPGAVSLLLAQFGYPNYANMLVTTQAAIDHNPAMIEAVVDATTEGWTECTQGHDEAAKQAILAASPSTPESLFDYSMAVMNARKLAGSGAEVGTMTDARWQDMYQSMAAVGVLPSGLDYRAAYTLRFVAHP